MIEIGTQTIVILQDNQLYLLVDTHQGETGIPLIDLTHIQTHMRMKLIDTPLGPIKESIHQDILPVIGIEFQSMETDHQSIDIQEIGTDIQSIEKGIQSTEKDIQLIEKGILPIEIGIPSIEKDIQLTEIDIQ